MRTSVNGGLSWCFGPAGTSQAAACADPEAWGKVCNVTINPCASAIGVLSGMDVETTNATLAMYPNPNRGDQLFVSMTDIDNTISTVTMDVYDMTGKRIVARTITAQDGFVNQAVDLNSELAAGLYLVNFTAGEQVFSERLIVQP
ncbi:MAG: T9SS type A sorting domain-containing protein [Flavobacteriales bacterium]|nr:T9SS type A sorting domain-containing protein [Flavobacteriales bacterium]